MCIASSFMILPRKYNRDADHTAKMRRLICTFVNCIQQSQVFSIWSPNALTWGLDCHLILSQNIGDQPKIQGPSAIGPLQIYIFCFVYYTVCVRTVKAPTRLPSLTWTFDCCQLCLLYCTCWDSWGSKARLPSLSWTFTCCQLCLLYCVCWKSEGSKTRLPSPGLTRYYLLGLTHPIKPGFTRVGQ